MKRFTIVAMATFSMSQLTSCVVAGGSRSNSGGGFLLLVFPIALALLLASLGRRRHGRRPPLSAPARANDDSVNRQVLEAELSVLADDVLRLEPQVAIHEQARGDYEAATHRYRVARAAIDAAEAAVDLVRVQRVVDEANWSMSRARATLEGRPPPDPPVKLQRPGAHGEPAVTVDAAQQPSYLESSAPFRSGWFSVGGGLFSGLLVGTMLGGFGGGWIVAEDDQSEVDGFGGSDW